MRGKAKRRKNKTHKRKDRELIIMDVETPPNGQRATLVVFTGETQLKWLKLFKPGFRHCFIALKTHGRWIVYNPLSHQTMISVHKDLSVDDMVKRLVELGCKVIQCAVRKAPAQTAPWRPYTCVEAVKRVLGIQDGWILTPWQLYRHLRNQ